LFEVFQTEKNELKKKFLAGISLLTLGIKKGVKNRESS